MTVNLVAEIGCNWDTLKTAFKMIEESKRSGANYVKFQLFNEQTIADNPLKEQLKPLILNEGMVESLALCAQKNKISFILTPMYLEAVDIAAKYADIIKIRYADNENAELIDKALDMGKTLLISVPHKLIDAFRTRPYHPRMKALYGLPKYPPEIEDFNLDFASCCDGTSLHFPHTICDLAYAINRIPEECWIEKHVMLSTKKVGIVANYSDGSKEEIATVDVTSHPIDEKVSILFQDLVEFKKQIDIVERIQRVRI